MEYIIELIERERKIIWEEVDHDVTQVASRILFLFFIFYFLDLFYYCGVTWETWESIPYEKGSVHFRLDILNI